MGLKGEFAQEVGEGQEGGGPPQGKEIRAVAAAAAAAAASFFFCFLGLHLWQTEVPRLGVESELQLQALHHSHSNAGSLTH